MNTITNRSFNHIKIRSLDSLEARLKRGEHIDQQQLADALSLYDGPIPPNIKKYICTLVATAPNPKGRPSTPIVTMRKQVMNLRHYYKLCRRYLRIHKQLPEAIAARYAESDPAVFEHRDPGELAAMMVAHLCLGSAQKFKTVRNRLSSQK